MKRNLVAFGLLLAASAAVTSASAQGVDGKTIYDAQCKKCHGATGKPVAAMAKKFPKMEPFTAQLMAKVSEDDIVKVLMKGKGDDMKSFKEKLKPEEMAAVAKYTHGLGTP